MKYAKLLTLGAAVALAVTFAPARAAAPNAAQMAPLQYLIGTWKCDWSAGGQTGSEDQIFTPALGGAWLEEKEVVTINGQAHVNSIHYTGYNPKTKKFMHVGPDADGTYELAESPDTNVWSSTDGRFTHTKVSDTKRTMHEEDSSSGQTVDVSMTCTKR